MLKRFVAVAPSILFIVAASSCKRDRSDAPPPDPLTPPAQSAPSATELAPVGQATDTPTPTGSTAPPPKDQGGGSGTGTTKKTEKKEEEKKEEEKKEEKKEEEKTENKGCMNTCQSAFMTCMTPKTGSGGFPQPPDPEACRKGLENCQGSCK
jgi:hypothetical protein